MKKALYNLVVLVLLVLVASAVMAEVSSAPAPSDGTKVRILRLYDADPASAGFFNQHRVIAYSRTSRNGEQTDLISLGGFSAECYVDNAAVPKPVIRMTRCHNVVYWVAVEEEIVLPPGTPGPAGPAGTPGAPGANGICETVVRYENQPTVSAPTFNPCPPAPQVIIRDRVIERVVTRTEYYPNIGGNGGFTAPPQGGGGSQIAVVPGERGILGELIGAAASLVGMFRRPGDFIVTNTVGDIAGGSVGNIDNGNVNWNWNRLRQGQTTTNTNNNPINIGINNGLSQAQNQGP